MIGPVTSYFRYPDTQGAARVSPEESPARIVEQGRIRLGMFDEPVREMNLADSRLLSGLGRSWPMPPLMLEWVGAGIAHANWYLGLIVVDAKVGSLGVLYGFNRRTGKYFSHDRPGLRRQVKVAGSTWNDLTRFSGRGFNIEIDHHLEEGFHDVRVDIAAAGKRPRVSGELRWREKLGETQPLVLLSPLEGGGFLYNHKAQMPTEGALRIGNEQLDFNPRRDISNMDDLKLHAGGTRLHYRWFNFGGFDDEGRLVGADLAASPQKGDPYWAENCLWVGGKLLPLGEVQFELDTKDPMKPWRARGEGIDLQFFPEGGKSVSIGPLGKYHQKCGTFRGTITAPSGETHEIRDYYGCAESANIRS